MKLSDNFNPLNAPYINQCDYGIDKLYTIKFYLINMNNVLFINSDLT